MSEIRPYPNVVARSDGRYAAYQPCKDGQRVHLGVYNSPQAARRAVLEAQAQNLEERARRYRVAAEEIDPKRRK